MGGEPAAPDVLSRPPRTPSAGVFDRRLVEQVLVLSVVLTGSCLALALWSYRVGGPWQTQLFVVLAVGQLALALALRPSGAWRSAAGRSATWVPAAVAANVVLLVAGVYLPGLSHLLGTRPLAPAELAVSVAAGLVPATALVVFRALRR
jgi:Ca2+-transporting ATPase